MLYPSVVATVIWSGASTLCACPVSSTSPTIFPLCIQSQRPWRNGCVFVSWIAVPVDARIWASRRRSRRRSSSSHLSRVQALVDE
jgi:hypothetical protein